MNTIKIKNGNRNCDNCQISATAKTNKVLYLLWCNECKHNAKRDDNWLPMKKGLLE